MLARQNKSNSGYQDTDVKKLQRSWSNLSIYLHWDINIKNYKYWNVMCYLPFHLAKSSKAIEKNRVCLNLQIISVLNYTCYQFLNILELIWSIHLIIQYLPFIFLYIFMFLPSLLPPIYRYIYFSYTRAAMKGEHGKII